MGDISTGAILPHVERVLLKYKVVLDCQTKNDDSTLMEAIIAIANSRKLSTECVGELIVALQDRVTDSQIMELIDKIPLCLLTSSSVSIMCYLLRTARPSGAQSLSSSDSSSPTDVPSNHSSPPSTSNSSSNVNTNSNHAPCRIAIRFHPYILRSLSLQLQADDPPHWKLPGMDDGFLVTCPRTPVNLSASASERILSMNSYTVTMWIKMDEKSIPVHGNAKTSDVLLDDFGSGEFEKTNFHDQHACRLIQCRLLPLSQRSSSINSHRRVNGGELDVFISDRQDDGVTWSITIATSSSSSGEGGDMKKAKVRLPVGQWTLIALSHSRDKSQRMQFSVNGEIQMDCELPFSFSTIQSLLQSEWKFGAGVKGKISSIAFYSEAVEPSQLQLLHDLGPYHHTLSHGINAIPQSSFDTGHWVLGTHISKGRSAHKACRHKPLAFVTPLHTAFSPSSSSNVEMGSHESRIEDFQSGLPQVVPGKLYVDHIEMVPCSSNSHREELDNVSVTISQHHCECILSGPCVSNVDAWVGGGRTGIALHLLWGYSMLSRAFSSTSPVPSTLSPLTSAHSPATHIPPSNFDHQNPSIVHDCMCESIVLIGTLIGSSALLKEQFIQLHGFHILGNCLATYFSHPLPSSNVSPSTFPLTPTITPSSPASFAVPSRTASVTNVPDKRDVEVCIFLTRALGVDAGSGDGIAAALQGVLLDFRIWRAAPLEVKLALMNSICSFMTVTGDALFRSIGVQRLLDILRLHVFPTTSPTLSTSSSASICSQQTLVELADVCHHLLSITILSSHANSLKTLSPFHHECESIWSCLEETSSSLLAERLLLLMHTLRSAAPLAVLKSFIELRVSETTAISLLSKRGFSLRVRRECLLLLLWGLGEEMRYIPNQLTALGKVQQAKWNNKKDQGNGVGELHPSLAQEYKVLTKPILRKWVNMQMLSEIIAQAIADGNWDFNNSFSMQPVNIQPINSTTSPQPPSQLSDVLEVFAHDGPLGRIDAWLTLPHLPVLIKRACQTRDGLMPSQRVLMSLNVFFKTNEAQCECLCTIPDRLWMKALIHLASIGENISHAGTSATYSSADVEVAATCTELALDSLSTVLEYKTRTRGENAWSSWQCLQTCLTDCQISNSSHRIYAEVKFLKRCISLVFQRLARSGGVEWGNPNGVLHCIFNVIKLVHDRRLCGNEPFSSTNRNPQVAPILQVNNSEVENLIDFASDAKEAQLLSSCTGTVEKRLRGHPPQQTSEEAQILCFLFDMMGSLRKAAVNGALYGKERPLLGLSLRITVGCMRIVTEQCADRIVGEIISQMGYMCSPWGCKAGKLGKDQFHDFILTLLTSLQSVHEDTMVPVNVRGIFDSLVFSMMHRFIELRHSVANGEYVAPHVLPTMDAMIGVENLQDVDLIFRLVVVSLRTANTITFEELPDVDDSLMISTYGTTDAIDSISSVAPLIDFPSFPTLDDITDDLSPTPLVAHNNEEESSTAKGTGNGNDSVSSHNAMNIADTATVTNSIPNTQSQAIVGECDGGIDSKDFQKWYQIRQGILLERIDSERARLAKSQNTLDLTAEATHKHWKRLRRKVESEAFFDAHTCQWKLGVSHEGGFPGRKRVVLRPRFDVQAQNTSQSPWHAGSSPSSGSSDLASISQELDDVTLLLGRACVGYIKEVTAEEGGAIISDGSGEKVEGSEPGSGWGIVGADGSDEGFGVMGLAADEVDGANANMIGGTGGVTMPTDRRSDASSLAAVQLIEDAIKNRREVDTSPCQSRSTRRIVGVGKEAGSNFFKESRVIMVTASGCFYGYLSFNGKDIYFTSSIEPEDGHIEDSAAVNAVGLRIRRRRWSLTNVCAIYLRRYRLRESAMEVFFRRGKHRNFFVDFGHTPQNRKERTAFARAIMERAPSSAFKQWPLWSNIRLVAEHDGLQEGWINGRISNFDYLMALNTISGRSFNDLCQYPIMPWVLAQYDQPTIDLNDPSSYRDLSKPMGAQNPARLEEYLDRFNSFAENVATDIPPFMYGSHYSTMVGVVLHFLIRLQPFAALHKEMQNGHFDVPDRLFSSIPATYRHNTTQLSEVKELTPEFFTTPDIFRNINNFHFGTTQDGVEVCDVELPPWAATPEDFVRINRLALESDYVSAHLHEWIDLIWGYKQRGEEAIKAHNVFYYLTYSDGVDRDKIEDESLRQALELQSAHFGQIPMALFCNPHPARKVLSNKSSVIPTFSHPRPLINNFATSSKHGINSPSPGNGDIADLAKPMTSDEALPIYVFLVPHTCDEELVISEAAHTVIPRGGRSSIVLGTNVGLEKITCLLADGTVEVYKYSVSETVKAAISQHAANTRSHRRTTSGSSGVPNMLHDIISFDDDEPNETTVTSNSLVGEMISNRILHVGSESLLSVEKESSHFDPASPRFPIHQTKINPQSPSFTTSDSFPPIVHVSKSGHIVFSAGRLDGGISVTEIDPKNGLVISGADFNAHRCRVTCLSSDSITSLSHSLLLPSTPHSSQSHTDVVVSSDESGCICVWTVSRVANQGPGHTFSHIISRRPQRSFRCPVPHQRFALTNQLNYFSQVYCDISWYMGIVVSGCGAVCSIFSVERDERLRAFDVCCSSVNQNCTNGEKSGCGICYDGNRIHADGCDRFCAGECGCFIRGMHLCDDGYVVLQVESKSASSISPCSNLLVYTLGGRKVGHWAGEWGCSITTLSIPNRGSVICTGHLDGSVRIFRTYDLCLLYVGLPHAQCCMPPPHLSKPTSNRMGGAAIISIAFGGGSLSCPTLMVMTSVSGDVYLRGLPDLIRWERNRSLSLIGRIAQTVHSNAVKTTISQAQNVIAWTKNVVGEAREELEKKVKRSSVLSFIGNAFGKK